MIDNKIGLTIDGLRVEGKQGDTILDVCRGNGIFVPTLCQMEGLSNVGACRLCVVEIDGERRINPACTYPARDGLVVRTHTPALEKHRRVILELLFTERNHFCFFCAASGDCELQSLAYRYQMDHPRYAYSFPTLPTDTLSKYMVFDHNRCVLCGRCVRTCGEIVGNHTLDFGKRGYRTTVTVDLNQPWGLSTCISCGACSQACPTGAIFSKVSVYKGQVAKSKSVKSVCSQCGAGCDIDVKVSDNNILRIDSANPSSLKGPLCYMGRFERVASTRARIASPLVRDVSGVLRASTWEDALSFLAGKMKGYLEHDGSTSLVGVASSALSNESLTAFSGLMAKMGSRGVDTFDGDHYRCLSAGIEKYFKDGNGLELESSMESILDADVVVVLAAQPLRTQPMIGSYVLRARNHGASVIVIDADENALGGRADVWLRPRAGGEKALLTILKPVQSGAIRQSRESLVVKAVESTGISTDDIEKAASLIGSARNGVVIFGEGITGTGNSELVFLTLKLAQSMGKVGPRVISLKPRGNSRGAWQLGLASKDVVFPVKPKFVYVLLGDDSADDGHWVARAEGADFLAVQASYRGRLTEAADVVLPSLTWAEQQGSFVSLDGKPIVARAVLEPLNGMKSDVDIIDELAKKVMA